MNARDLLDLVHDGLATPEERARFDTELARSPALAAELALQRDLDARLRRLFAIEDAPVAPVEPLARRRPRRWAVWTALAAAAGLAAWIGLRGRGAEPVEAPVGGSWATCVAHVAAEPPPGDVMSCSIEAPLAAATRASFGTPLDLPPGWTCVRSTAAVPAGVLLFRVTDPSGRSALLVVRAGDAGGTLPAAKGLAFDRRTVGGLDCIEVVSGGPPFVLPALGPLVRMRADGYGGEDGNAAPVAPGADGNGAPPR
jgi:hypothetical protein